MKKNLKHLDNLKVEIKKYEKNEPVEISIKIDLDPSMKIFPFDEIEIIKRQN